MLAAVARRRPIFYGWWIVIGGVLASAVGSGLTFWSFTVYIPPLEEAFGWSRGEISGAFSLGRVAFALSSPLAGRAVDRFGARRCFFFGALAAGASFLLLSRVQELWQLYLVYTLSALSMPWVVFVPVQWLLVQWFDRRRGAAMGVASAGFGLGGAIFPPVVVQMVGGLGWRLSMALSAGVMAATYMLLLALVFHNRPADLGLQPDGSTLQGRRGSGPAVSRSREWTVAEAMRSPVFWSLSVAFLLFFSAYDSFIVHAVPFFESVGRSAQQGAAVISYSAIIITAAGVASGFLLDRLSDLRPSAVGFCAAQAVGLLFLVLSVGTPSIVGFIILWSLGSGAGSTLHPLLFSRIFGSRSFGTILGLTLMLEPVGTVIGPLLGGILFDVLSSYTVPFLLYVGFSAGAGAAFFLAGGGRALRRA